MNHEDALEALELAAVEPGGLDRLMAGDTVMAAAVAGHVAGCTICAAELERLTGEVPLLQDVIRTSPPADLRARALGFVQANGVARGARGPVVVEVMDDVGEGAAPAESAPSGPALPRPAASRGVLPWVAAVAAAVVIAVVGTTVLVGARFDQERADRDAAIAHLGSVTAATLSITAEPDVQRVTLAATDGSAPAGTLLYSPSTTELVVVATDLVQPPAGREYRCWVLRDGEREPVGRMFFAGALAYWIGDVAALRGVIGDATFGVSLVDIGGGSLDAPPVISGGL